MPLRVAVVGSGVSGLAATWLLNEHSDHVVDLFEADSRPGGHANTVTFTPPKDSGLEPCEVDTGFIVTNPVTYPNFLRFLKLKGVPTVNTMMTFSVSRDRGAFEWAGTPNPASIFCQPRNLLKPQMWRMIWDVLRFNACALELLEDDCPDKDVSIGDYLEKHGYSNAFRDDYLLPMTAAIWSTPPDKCSLGFPAQTLVRFFANHHLLQILNKPPWMTIPGGSTRYVKKIIERVPPSRVHLNTAIQSITSSGDAEKGTLKVTLTTADGSVHEYDRVILATHSDTALRILGDGTTKLEREVLGQFEWNTNEAILHSDISLMPRSRMAWAAWNYLTSSYEQKDGSKGANVSDMSLTYGMNTLQHLDENRHGPVLVTLNPPFEPAADKVVGRWKYEHPVLDTKAISAQDHIPSIQNVRGIAFAGAWVRYGFHEDGFTSGLRAAVAVTQGLSARKDQIRLPFDIRSAERTHKRDPWLCMMFNLIRGSGIGDLAQMLVELFCYVLTTMLLGSQSV
ncbi:FAD/NAD(P)-binding domain-containing protein [Auriculariales sp. MPI-PUGE-AT-0066]|nr:FAD/NAD(P)-binding domain-containing protein [Auriculariales sp. MPI-PUGE-AT-0066]